MILYWIILGVINKLFKKNNYLLSFSFFQCFVCNQCMRKICLKLILKSRLVEPFEKYLL